MSTAPPPPSFPFPLAEHLGMTTSVVDTGSAESRLLVSPGLLNPHGAVHGAVLFAMADTAMGAATMSVLPPGELCASVDVQLRFCTAVFDGLLVGRADVVKAGKRIVHLRAAITDESGDTVAFGTGAFSVIPQRDGGSGR